MRIRFWCVGLLCALALVPLHAQETVPTAEEATVAPRSLAESLAALRPVMLGKAQLPEARKRLALQLLRRARATRDAAVLADDAELVTREFGADVVVAYSLDLGEGTRLVSRAMMEAWGLDAERLHARALANLEADQGAFPIQPVGRLPWLYVIDAHDGYAASRVLLAWRWPEIVERLGEPLVLAMPSQDVVVLTATQDADKLAQLRDTVDTVWRHQARPVSAQLFRWTGTGWQPLISP